ncbi:MAG: YCF48-related protein [Flavobacteriales bacterium]|nr:YCF48-related protein [Flavobacteriales bacterium]
MKLMKLNLLVLLIFIIPNVFGQWSAVRWDSTSSFHQINIVNENLAFFSGYDASQNPLILRTTDGGTTYDTIQPNANAFFIKGVQFFNADTGFLTVSDPFLNTIYKTIDGGNTWQMLPAAGFSIQQSFFVDENVGFFTEYYGISRTTDGGNTKQLDSLSLQTSDIEFIDANTGFISGANPGLTSAMIYGTTDGGNTWDTLLIHSDPNTFTDNFTEIDVVNGTTLFSVLENTNVIYTSSDAGVSWNTIVVDSADFIVDISFISASVGYVLSGNGKILRTSDGGQNWVKEYEVIPGLYGPSYALNALHFSDSIGYSVGTNGLIKKQELSPSPSSVSTILDEKISVFPNPAVIGTTLQVVSDEEIEEIQIHHISGKRVMSISPIRVKSEINLESGLFETGTYVLSFRSKTDQSNRVLVVQ